MAFVKGFVAGISAAVIYLVVIAVVLWLRIPPEGVGAIALPGWPVLAGAVLIFAATFYWTAKKSS